MWQNLHLSHNSCFPGSLTAQFSYLVILLLYSFLVLGHVQKNSGLSGEKRYFFFLIRFSIFPPKTHNENEGAVFFFFFFNHSCASEAGKVKNSRGTQASHSFCFDVLLVTYVEATHGYGFPLLE